MASTQLSNAHMAFNVYNPPIPVICVLLIILLYIIHRFLGFPYDPREPPLIRPAIPVIGHVIGLLRDGTKYYSTVANRCSKPIFTLALPGGKMYVVTSPHLVAACDRRANVVSFAPYVVEFGRRLLLASESTVELLSENLLEEKGVASLRPETMKAIKQSLMPGGNLNEMTRTFLKSFVNFIDSDFGSNGEIVSLFPWVHQCITLASTDAIYGPNNPMRNTKVMDGFWAFDKDFAYLGLMVFSQYVAPKGSIGRRTFFDAFDRYYASGGLETASNLIKSRHEVNRKYGVPERDIAQFDLGVCTGLLVNTIPAVFWTLWYVFSDPSLLEELRHRIENEAFDQANGLTGGSHVTINIARVIEAIPLLESLVNEVLRAQSHAAHARSVLRDTLLQDGDGVTYLLKKGSTLVMPAAPVHQNEAAWGPTAQVFDPARFVKLKERGRRVASSAWRVFGGGNAFCPGRYFALREIMIVLVIMILKYRLEPMEGTWKKPKTKHHVSTSIPTPIQDIRVRVLSRKDLGNIQWSFVWEP